MGCQVGPLARLPSTGGPAEGGGGLARGLATRRGRAGRDRLRRRSRQDRHRACQGRRLGWGSCAGVGRVRSGTLRPTCGRDAVAAALCRSVSRVLRCADDHSLCWTRPMFRRRERFPQAGLIQRPQASSGVGSRSASAPSVGPVSSGRRALPAKAMLNAGCCGWISAPWLGPCFVRAAWLILRHAVTSSGPAPART